MPQIPFEVKDSNTRQTLEDLYRYAGRARYVGQTRPSSPAIGEMWYNELTDTFQIWDGRTWKAH